MRLLIRRAALALALAGGVVALSGGAAISDESIPGVRTGEPIQLFNGRNLDNFYTFLRTKGKNNDPDRVFTVRNGMLRVSGSEFGHFITEEEFENYHLIVEYRWGEETHPPRKENARDSGILFHYVGPDKVWGKSVEFQIIEGGTGDIILVDGASIVFNGERHNSGRIDRYNKGPWRDVLGYRDPNGEVENAHGEWNRLDLLADGGSGKYWVNGKLVNHYEDSEPRKGKILFQSEGAELFFRRIELRPILK